MTLARTLYNYDLHLPGKTTGEWSTDFEFQVWAVASGTKNQIGNKYSVGIPNITAMGQKGSNF